MLKLSMTTVKNSQKEGTKPNKTTQRPMCSSCKENCETKLKKEPVIIVLFSEAQIIFSEVVKEEAGKL